MAHSERPRIGIAAIRSPTRGRLRRRRIICQKMTARVSDPVGPVRSCAFARNAGESSWANWRHGKGMAQSTRLDSMMTNRFQTHWRLVTDIRKISRSSGESPQRARRYNRLRLIRKPWEGRIQSFQPLYWIKPTDLHRLSSKKSYHNKQTSISSCTA